MSSNPCSRVNCVLRYRYPNAKFVIYKKMDFKYRQEASENGE